MFEDRQRVIQHAQAWMDRQKPGSGGLDAVLAPKPRLGPKKPVGIEDLLRWTYRDELPKDQNCGAARFMPGGFGHAWGSVSQFAELLTVVDAEPGCNQWGVLPDKTAGGDPHPDALVVGNAVIDLAGLILDLPPDWDPLSDLGDMGGHGPRVLADSIERLTFLAPDGSRQHRLDLRRLVFRHAIMGGCPPWEAEVPEVKEVRGANGKPRYFIQREVMIDGIAVVQECDGWSATQRRPLYGSYVKTYLDPDPVDAAVARAEYEIWRAALDVLTGDLTGQMRDFEVVACTRPRRPWEEGAPAARRVLPDLTPEPGVPVVKKPRRRGRSVRAA